MRILSIAILLTLFISIPAFCQIDTLELVEIGSIQASSEITELYVEDLDGDSLKEIILCTNYFVYIYDSQTYQVEWTSPPLLAPTDLLFEDINGDGLIDLSVKDSTNIYLYDPHAPSTIWTSPPLDSTYSCYTIGDRNDDDLIDVAIVTKEPFTRPGIENNMDTVYIEILEGPLFQHDDEIIILLSNYTFDNCSYYEYPDDISFEKISGTVGLEKILLLITKMEKDCNESAGHINWGYESGSIWLIPYQDTNRVQMLDIGEIQKITTYEEVSDTLLCVTTKRHHWHGGMGWLNYYKLRRLFSISADTIIYEDILWQDAFVDYYGSTDTMRYYKGEIIDDMNSSNPGLELCFGYEDSLELWTFPGQLPIWILPDLSNLVSIRTSYNNQSFFNNPQIICKMIEYYAFIDGNTGAISSIILSNDDIINKNEDLNSDGNDEILSIQGSALYIYGLDYATGIGDNTRLPQQAFLRTNYPNPFNSSTTIEYGLPEAEHVIVEIYDLLGRKVETLINEEVQAGRHQVVWEADRNASGLYFYRIEAGDYADTKRMVYLK